ncbi:MAG: homoserine dehydrogenase [Hyphomonadaceae bacterium]|nr:homoserine dehydrogenase [Hyphomonadaceae bacterium]
MFKDKLRVGIAGLGTVGGGVVKLFEGTARLGERLSLTAVSARSRGRARGVDIAGYRWFDDPVAMAADPDIDVVVEVIGGGEGVAKNVVETAVARGAHVVTANKALLAVHGAALARLAERNGAKLLFEAAVGGGVPMVKALKESLSGCRATAVAGILNGTCNYILTEMEASGRSFEAVLADAQRLGYAEADPTMDVGGFDAAHKLTLLAAIAFGVLPDFDHVRIEGIERVSLTDIRMAGKLGYRIKLIAKAAQAEGGVEMHVRPALLSVEHPLANIGGSLNALVVDAEPVGQLTFIGRGAGEGPTAASVASDLMDLAEERGGHVFGRPVAQLADAPRASPVERGRYYLRLMVFDRPGVVAAVSDKLAHEDISIESFLQMPAPGEQAVPIVLTTQACGRAAVEAAVRAIHALGVTAEPPYIMPVEETRARFGA